MQWFVKPSLHGLVEIPPGKTVADLLPAFRGVKGEIHIGEPNRACASCGKPFSAARKRRGAIRLYGQMDVPVVSVMYVCGHCRDLYRRDGAAKDGVLAAVQAYFEGRGNEC